MHPLVLRELSDVIARRFSIIFGPTWQLGEVPKDWRSTNGTPVFKNKKEDLAKYRPVRLSSIPSKVMERLILETTCRHMNDWKIMRNSQHEFTKWKACFSNLVSFYIDVRAIINEVTSGWRLVTRGPPGLSFKASSFYQ